MEDYQPGERRPLASRETGWAQAISARLVALGASPNGISTASVLFAGAAALAIVATEHLPAWSRVLWLAAAAGVQLRLLANLFDGMVAVESGKASPVGELFNEVPDRISDVAVFAAMGVVAGSSIHLGYGAAVLAVFVAYVRSMGAVAGAGQVFGGIMSKPRRMFAVTVLCLFQALAPASWLALRDPWGLGPVGWCLGLLVAGCLITSVTRLSTIATTLRGQHA